MRIAILHLSDMHCKSHTTLKPASSLAACFRELDEKVDKVIIAVTGDISFSGKVEEYQIADSFFKSLEDEVHTVTGLNPITVIVPGNHDCAHLSDPTVRELVLKGISDKKGKVNSLTLIDHATEVQNNFFSWRSRVEPGLSGEGRIAWPSKIQVGEGKNLFLLCINSAWMSTEREVQGRLYLPSELLPSPDKENLVVTLIHHPYNWFEANNARALRQHLEAVSDIILTGHEHDAVIYSKNFTDGSIEYVEGGVFHTDSDPETSHFCLLQIDLSSHAYQVNRYSWASDGYRNIEKSEKSSYVRTLAPALAFTLQPQFIKFLQDLGMPFTHSAKHIEFDDLYITPSLRRYLRSVTGESLTKQIIDSDHVLSTIFSEKAAYFAGDAQSGKTSLAKRLYSYALQRGLFPVYIKGEALSSIKPAPIQKEINKAFKEQYSNPDPEWYVQQPPENKVIIIDDLPDSKLNRTAKAQVIEQIRERYQYVYIFGGDFSHMEELLADMEEGDLISNLPYFEIMQFGFLLRNKLVEKWFTLGSDNSTDKETLAFQVKEIERLLNTILGKNYIPAYPVFILALLQQLEAGAEIDTKSGAYGYFYENLITNSLYRASRSRDDVDAKYTFLSEFAWYLRGKRRRECDQEDLASFIETHWQNYRLTQNKHKFVEEILNAQVLVTHGDRIGFRYKYLYFYFIARHMHNNLSEPLVVDAIDECVRDLHREECANVMIFLTYLTKDSSITDKLLKAAKSIYASIPPCDLKIHVEFLNKLDNSIPQIVLPDIHPTEAKNQTLKHKDSKIEGITSAADANGMLAEEEPKDLNKMVEINRSYKSMQIMGQILRNFSGSLKGPIKKELAQECFTLGLRTLNMYYMLIEKHLDRTVSVLADILDKNIKDMEPDDRIKESKRLIFLFTEVLGVDIVQRISTAVGAEKLQPTYDDVQSTMDNHATEIIQVGIRMDHFSKFPSKRVTDLFEKLEDNIFGKTLLKILVANHFYMFPRPYRTRQSICAQLGIEQTKAMLLDNPERKKSK